MRRLGGSRIAAALGLSRRATPLDVYLELREEPKEIEEPTAETNDDALRGTLLEDGLRKWTNLKVGIDFIKPEETIVSPVGDGWFTYSPDGLTAPHLSSPAKLLEIKSPSPFTAYEWGQTGGKVVDLSIAPPGTIPGDYFLQGAWGLFVTNSVECFFSALIGGELRIYRLQRDEALEKKLVSRATEFIERHVLPGVPPPAQYGDDDNLKRLHPKAAHPAIEWNALQPMARQTVADWLRVKQATGEAMKELDSLEVLVKDVIGDKGGVVRLPPDLGFERIDYKEQSPAFHAGCWKQLAEELMKDKTDEQKKELFKKFTPELGTRPLVARKLSKKAKP